MTRFEAIALGLGLALLATYGTAHLLLERSRERVVAEFLDQQRSSPSQRVAPATPMRARSSAGVAAEPRSLSIAAPDTRAWSIGRTRAFQALAPAEPMGVLRVASLALEVPIYAGTSELSLNRGAGLIEGTAPLGAQGNTGLAAHRDGFFRALERVALGDRLEIDTRSARHAYRVSDIRIVAPSAVEVLAPTDHAVVTLVTCYPFYFVGPAPERFVVRAERIAHERESLTR